MQKKGKELVGQTGKSIFIVHDSCLPQSSEKNTGAANLSMKESQDFLAYMKSYLGFNTVQILPAGELCPNDNFYCPYSSSALSLGSQQINSELLTQKEFGEILLPEEFKEIVASNTSENKDTIANYKNVVGKNSSQEIALRKSYKRFKLLDENTVLKKKFTNYVEENNDWLEPKAIYKILENEHKNKDFSYWSGIDSELYDFNYMPEEKKARISQILKENSDEVDFYKFKQFLAEEHLAIGRKKLNKMGLQLIGDCQINFSKDEIWANPYAFKNGYFIGEADWFVPSLDFDAIKNPESPSAKLLKRKVQLNAKRYDGIRFDAGWAYVNPAITHYTGKSNYNYLGETVLNFIEKSVKEIKGDDYDLKNLIYEFQGGKIFDGTNLYPPVDKRVKIQDTVYMHEYPDDIWASNDAFIKRGWKPDNFIAGVGNHDSQPLRQIANNTPDITAIDGQKYHKNDAIQPLSRILKLDPKSLENPVEFAKAKWAEPFMAKNNMMFYMDVFGREERFNMHQYNSIIHPEKNFAYKIPADYKNAYNKALQEGFGFNIMDSLEKAFVAKGLNKTQPKLYKEIVKFRDILYENDTGITKNILKNNKIIIIGIAICAIGAALVLLFKNKKASDTNISLQKSSTQKINPAQTLQDVSKINIDNFINTAKSKVG